VGTADQVATGTGQDHARALVQGVDQRNHEHRRMTPLGEHGPRTWKARRYGGTVPAGSRETSADDRLQRITKCVGLVRSHLNDETATTLQRDAHHDAATLLGDLQRTIARPRLHRRHLVSPQTYIRVGGLPHSLSSTSRAQPHVTPYLISDRRP